MAGHDVLAFVPAIRRSDRGSRTRAARAAVVQRADLRPPPADGLSLLCFWRRGDSPRVVGAVVLPHFPEKGFVGDIFTVNGKAFPVLEVKRRKYRFRFLDLADLRLGDRPMTLNVRNVSRQPAGGTLRVAIASTHIS